MEDFFRIIVSELILKYGPGVLPWLCLLVILGTCLALLRFAFVQIFAQQKVMIDVLREGNAADLEHAKELRRVADAVLIGGLMRKR